MNSNFKFVTDNWEVVGVAYRLFPGGVECEVSFIDEAGIDKAASFVPAPDGQYESYDRHKLAAEALRKAVDGIAIVAPGSTSYIKV